MRFNINKGIWVKLIQTIHEVKVNILWNQQVQADRTSPNNKPDITIHCSEKVIIPVNGHLNFRKQNFDLKRIRTYS